MTGPVDRDELVRCKEDVKLDCGCTDPGGFVSLADSALLKAQFVLPETQSKRIRFGHREWIYLRAKISFRIDFCCRTLAWFSGRMA